MRRGLSHPPPKQCLIFQARQASDTQGPKLDARAAASYPGLRLHIDNDGATEAVQAVVQSTILRRVG
jgi:hypothetical protein